MPKKHEEHEEHVNHEAWVIPYADMLTLLMGLFLVMWSLGAVDLAKMRQVGRGFASQLGVQSSPMGQGAPGILDSNTGLGVGDVAPAKSGEGSGGAGAAAEAQAEAKSARADSILLQEKQRQQAIRDERGTLEATKNELEREISEAGFSGDIQFKIDDRGLVVLATEGLLFDLGSAELKEPGTRALEVVAGPLNRLTQPLIVEGHTDDLPINAGPFPSNWELSTARASTVLRFLVDRHGFPMTRVSAAGYADQLPIADNATAEGRARNRRVELVLRATAATKPLPAGTEGIPGVTTEGFPPAPIGNDGPMGKPENLGPPPPLSDANPKDAATEAAEAEDHG